MNEHDPNDVTTSTDLDATSVVPTAAPLTPAAPQPSYAAPQPLEPGVAWAPAVPVSTKSTPRRGGRLRWAAAIAIVALVIGATGVVAALITGSTAASTVMGYVPDKTVVYGEVRLDLPGDQRKAVGEFLSKFPGFKDQASLETKIDEALDSFVKSATKDQTYTTDIKPWFDGQLGFSVGPLPPASSITKDSSSLEAARYLALLSIKDPAAAQAWFDGVITKSGAKTTTETYDGATLTISAEPDKPKAAFAVIDGKVAAIGDVASVKAAIDTDGKSGFAAEPGPKAALDAADGDHVGFLYVAIRPLLDWSTDLTKAAAPSAGTAANSLLSGALLKTVPAWTAYWLSFESDAIVMEAAAPKPATAIGPTQNRTSTVVEHVPASALAVSVSNDFGDTIKELLALYGSDPALKEMVGQLDKALDLVGGADAAFGWAGDTAIVVNVAGDTPEAGLVIQPTDKAAARQLFTALKALIALGGSTQGITVRDESYAGTTITIVDLGDLGKLAGAGDVKVLGGALPTGRVEIAYAATDDIVVIGSGPGFVKAVLDTTKATSLASDPQYKTLADRAGAGTSSAFVDITAIRGLVEKGMVSADPAGKAKYESDVKPFLVPFDALFASNSTGGDLTESVVYITVK